MKFVIPLKLLEWGGVSRSVYSALILFLILQPLAALAAPPKQYLSQDDLFKIIDENGKEFECGSIGGEYVPVYEPKSEKYDNFYGKVQNQKKKIKKAKKANKPQATIKKLTKTLKNLKKANAAGRIACSQGPSLKAPLGEALSLEKLDKELSEEDVRYFLEKAGFGRGPREEYLIDIGVGQGIDALVDAFMTTRAEDADLMARVTDRLDGQIGSTTTQTPSGQRAGLMDLWANTNNPYAEKLAIFLLSVWTVAGDVIADETFRHVWWNYNNKIRSYAYADTDLPTMALDITRDPLMLIFLNNELNVKGNPNENYARELMELFTLGPTDLDNNPNYTETTLLAQGDIANAAKALTGWTVKKDYTINDLVSKYDPKRHESGPHLMFADKAYRIYVEDDAALVSAIFTNHPNVSIYYANEILQWYLTAQPSRELIENFAAVIKANNFKLRPAMKTFLSSKAFFYSGYRDTAAKDSVEFGVEVVRTLGLDKAFNPNEAQKQIEYMGMLINNPPSVFWFNPSSWTGPSVILERANYVAGIFGDTTAQQQSDPDWSPVGVLPAGAATAAEVIDYAAAKIGCSGITADQRALLEDYMGKIRNYDGSFTKKSYDNTDINAQSMKGLGVYYQLLGLPCAQLK